MFKVRTIDETIELIGEKFSNMYLEVFQVESVNSYGFILAKDIYATENVPHFNRSTVDGYAVSHSVTQLASSSIPVVLKNLGEVLMGEESKFQVSDEETVYVPTGGHLPSGADSVVMVENTELLKDEVIVNNPTSKWENVLLKGSDISTDDLVLKKGTMINERHIGVLTALGVKEVTVYKKIKCLVISTGDEIVRPHEAPKVGEIRDINTYTVSKYLENIGLIVTDTLVIKDDFLKYKKAILDGFNSNDIVITSGGSSVGTKDYTIKVMNEINAELLVHGINIKPGKPTIIARYNNKLFFGLPGQPTSAYVVLNTFINDMVSYIYGMKKRDLPYYEGELKMNVHSARGRRTYQLVEYNNGKVIPLFTKSGMMLALSKANGYIVISEFSEGLVAGTNVKVYRFGD
ncbi:molybdopterin molybdotransferase MoeA [Mycoplasmatota bacterium]|nr:molybdopterin molybdotransferase MoeA [Mycoplasmatota bacterium]